MLPGCPVVFPIGDEAATSVHLLISATSPSVPEAKVADEVMSFCTLVYTTHHILQYFLVRNLCLLSSFFQLTPSVCFFHLRWAGVKSVPAKSL